MIGKAARDSTDKELRKRAILIAAQMMDQDDGMTIKAVKGVRQKQNKKGNIWCPVVKHIQVGSFTPVLANALYRMFLVDKAIETNKEFRTDTIKNATTTDSGPAPAPATIRIANTGKLSGQKRSSSQISGR